MICIHVKNARKLYKIPRIQPGLVGAVKSILYRNYEIREAVKDISFDVEEGEVVGFIGPNGAGKSTTIKMVSGVLKPDGGQILVAGQIPFENHKENAKRIGVVFGQRSQLYWDLPVEDTFEIYQKLYSIPVDIYKNNKAFLIDLLEMKGLMSQPVRQLSLGQKMKANIAIAMLHSPKILYLDEPTIGLDVMTKRKLRECIKEINRQYKTTVLLTTHDMNDVEDICKRIVVIDKGELLFDGSLKDFRTKYTHGTVYKLEFDRIPDKRIVSGFECTIDGKCWILQTDAEFSNDTLISLINVYNPRKISYGELTIEDIICRVFDR